MSLGICIQILLIINNITKSKASKQTKLLYSQLSWEFSLISFQLFILGLDSKLSEVKYNRVWGSQETLRRIVTYPDILLQIKRAKNALH